MNKIETTQNEQHAGPRELTLFAGTLPLTFIDRGEGRPHLLLHGGAGPGSMIGLGRAIAERARAIVPTHPGFDGKPRPAQFARPEDLTLAYLALVEALDLRGVVLVGNSMGGWIAAEMALRKSPRIAGVVLLNAVGIDTGSLEKSIVDPAKLQPQERASMAFHDPKKFGIAPSTPEAMAVMVENQRTLRVYSTGAAFMHDPSLRGRLAELSVPALVLWGESDRIVDLEYGKRFAESMPGARFHSVAEAGHFPQIERLEEVVQSLDRFSADLPAKAH